ncbi:hypothetical protein [Bradyrhizobium sp.]|uniref:hypothetical protein n=1 Tax=Bradyrhizobium sp. TaxID=376 RepID=UPI002733CCAB|nr:hypothetical protein [Bradyrhizobium sp.]MDP3078663.1 hypothetical protein [Bradyrhizobium sp.]
MKKILIATAMTLMCGSAFAQNTGAPAAAQSDMNKPGMNNSTNSGTNSGMNSGTTGAGMQKDGMSKDGMQRDNMNQGGASKDGMGQQNKGGTSK